MFFGDLPQWNDLCDTGIGELYVDAAFLGLYRCVQTVEIGEVSHVALNARDVVPDFLNRRIELRRPAPGNEDIRALRDESPRRRQTDAAITSSHNCHFAFKFSA